MLALLLGGLLYSLQAGTSTQSQIDDSWSRGLNWLAANQTGEGSWNSPPGIEMITASLALEAFRRANVQGQNYSRAVAWVANTNAYSVDARARQAIALYNAGINVVPFVTTLVAMRNNDSVWGAYSGYVGSFPDTSLALDTIQITGNPTGFNTGTSIGNVTAKQNPDGGWASSPSEIGASPSRVVPTAHNLLTLVRYGGPATNINSAVAWLKGRQKSDGGFGDSASATVYETAMAYAALAAAAGANDLAAGTALDFLLNRQQADGSWVGDVFQTALTLQVLPAPSSTPSIAQNPIAGNGRNTSGPVPVTTLGGFFTNQFGSSTLTAPGAQTWKLVAGKLPPGVGLTNGVINGIPSVAGTFTFTVQAFNAWGTVVATQTYQIFVTTAPPTPGNTMLNPAILDLLLSDDE